SSYASMLIYSLTTRRPPTSTLFPYTTLFRSTLIEGSIQIKMRTNPKQNVILKPGQQAQLITKTEISRSEKSDIKVLNVDTGPATAWKEGYFSFDGVSLPELMRQLARWYNMEVIYENPVSDFEFVGRIERSTQLSN